MPFTYPGPSAQSAPTGNHDPVMPRPEQLSRIGARLLDPATAVVFGTQRIRPTVYIADQLLVRSEASEPGFPSRPIMQHIRDAAEGFGLTTEVVGELPIAGATCFAVRLLPEPGGAAVNVDAWQVLQKARALADPEWAATPRPDGPELPGLELNHLMFIAPVTPAPYNEPHPYETLGTPYADLAYTGPRPVAFIQGLPKRSKRSKRSKRKTRRPIVAVADTGCGPHPGLDGVVTYEFAPRLAGVAVASRANAQGYEYYGDPDRPLDGTRDLLAGHGSFICGLVRQACPAADIVSVPIVEPNGRIPKENLLHALDHIAALVEANLRNSNDGLAIDVVSVSAGFYQELPRHLEATVLLSIALEKLTRLGVIVVMSAGNDRTSRESYPAALAEPGRYSWTSGLLVSVGALNPDGSSVAQFSNSGKWVTTWQRGAAVVSTMPVDFQFSLQPGIRTPDRSGRDRASVDGDDFSGGYAIASGTSYATPIVAGRIAHLLDKHGALDHRAKADRQCVVQKVLREAEKSGCS